MNKPLSQWIFTIQSGALSDQSLELSIGTHSIGRNIDNQIIFDDPSVSDKHALLNALSAELWIQDLDSTNGTYVNAQKITTPVRLYPGDTLQIGGSILVIIQARDPSTKAITPKARESIQTVIPTESPPSGPHPTIRPPTGPPPTQSPPPTIEPTPGPAPGFASAPPMMPPQDSQSLWQPAEPQEKNIILWLGISAGVLGLMAIIVVGILYLPSILTPKTIPTQELVFPTPKKPEPQISQATQAVAILDENLQEEVTTTFTPNPTSTMELTNTPKITLTQTPVVIIGGGTGKIYFWEEVNDKQNLNSVNIDGSGKQLIKSELQTSSDIKTNAWLPTGEIVFGEWGGNKDPEIRKPKYVP